MTLQLFKNVTALSSKPDIQQAIAESPECQKLLQQGYKFEAAHEYNNKDGNTLFYRVRLKNTHTKDKWIRPVHFNGSKWIWKEPDFEGGKKPLYNLKAITSKPKATIFVCEGEWAADMLNKQFALCGFSDKYIVTTSGSATSAGKAEWSPLINREVIIWPDNDVPGFEYARQVMRQLEEVNNK